MIYFIFCFVFMGHTEWCFKSYSWLGTEEGLCGLGNEPRAPECKACAAALWTISFLHQCFFERQGLTPDPLPASFVYTLPLQHTPRPQWFILLIYFCLRATPAGAQGAIGSVGVGSYIGSCVLAVLVATRAIYGNGAGVSGGLRDSHTSISASLLSCLPGPAQSGFVYQDLVIQEGCHMVSQLILQVYEWLTSCQSYI